MKKIVFVFVAVIMLCSCAQKQQYIIPANVKARNHAVIFRQAFSCLKLSNEGIEKSMLYIHPGHDPNAWIDPGNDVHITEGLFQFNDETLAFVIAHELSHAKLHHVGKKILTSMATTSVMMVANAFIPGIGLLNHVVNPAVTNNFNKLQELDADRLASETLITCFGIPVDRQIIVLESIQKATPEGGGFWAQHPSWSDRINAIRSR
jgi:Zn-dependent protease with chaperone function